MSEEVGNIGKHSQQTNQFNQKNSELHLNNCLITLLLPFATNNSLRSDQMVETKKKKKWANTSRGSNEEGKRDVPRYQNVIQAVALINL